MGTSMQPVQPKSRAQEIISMMQMLQNVGPDHPRFAEAQSDMNELKGLLKTEVGSEQQFNQAQQQDEARQNVMGPVATGFQKAGEVVGSIPKAIVDFANPIAGTLSQLLGADRDKTLKSEQALQKLSDEYLSPSSYLSPDEQSLVSRSREASPLATDVGEVGGVLAPFAAMAGKHIAERSGLNMRKLQALTEAREMRRDLLGEKLKQVREGLQPAAPPSVQGYQPTEGSVGRQEASPAGTTPAQPMSQPKPSGQATSGYGGNPRGIDFTGTGPALKSISPADEALERLKQNPWQQTAETIQGQRSGVSSLDEMINRNAQPPLMDTGNLTNQIAPQFEEGLPAARTSTLPKASNADIDAYLKKIAQASQEGYGAAPSARGGFQ